MSLLARLKRRGVLRVAFSYAVIAWLVLQIGDVVLDPFDFGNAAMRVLLVVVALGFPVALALAWFFELTSQGAKLDRGPASAPRPSVGGVRRYADILIIGLLVIVVAVLLARQGGLIEEATGEQVVAVLPFANMGPEAEDTYFGEGLADTLIHRLGQLSELVVLASQSTFEFKGRDLDLDAVGAKLGATTIMTGSVQRAGNSLRVNARLVEVGSGKQLWAESYDRYVADVFAIQDEIASSVTKALQLVLAADSQDRLATPATTSLTAYESYVLGVARLAARSGENLDRASDYFRQAIAADPDYALAYTGLVEVSYVKSGRFFHNNETMDDIVSEAVDAASQASRLDPGLGEAWLARAQAAILERDYRGSRDLGDREIIALFEKAIALSPNNALAYKYFSNFYSNQPGRDDDRVLELLKTASKLDPRSGIIDLNLGHTYVLKSDLEQAEFHFRRALRTQEPHFALAFQTLVDFHLTSTGRLDDAARWARQWVEEAPAKVRALSFYQGALMHLGAWDAARSKLGQIAEIARSQVGNEFNEGRFDELHYRMTLARTEGDLDRAYEFAVQLSTELLEKSPDWPVLQRAGWLGSILVTRALQEIRAGRGAVALRRFEAAYPGPFEEISTQGQDVLSPVVMTAALMKLEGENAEAETLLRQYLAFVRNAPPAGPGNHSGFTVFTIHAMLGEREQAIEALEAAIDSGYFFDWWMLRDGAFDPDYASVISDPSFEELYSRLTAQVDQMRESYFARPELPKDVPR